tara:strand:+ start:272 stop:604 length:333 start_codon:yes stop_codon:yes gene_type:complete
MTVYGNGAVQSWANIDGDDSPAAIRDDYNVSSITDHDTGYCTCNFSTNMPNNDYAAFAYGSTGNDLSYSGIDSSYIATGSCRWITRTSRTSNATDFPLVVFIAIGDAHYG